MLLLEEQKRSADIEERLNDAFGEDVEFEEKGQPTDFSSAQALAELEIIRLVEQCLPDFR